MVRGTALGKRENEHIVRNVYVVFCTGPLPLLYLEYWCQKEHKTVLALITMQVVRRLRKNKQLKNSAEDLKKSPQAVCKKFGKLNLLGGMELGKRFKSNLPRYQRPGNLYRRINRAGLGLLCLERSACKVSHLSGIWFSDFQNVPTIP